MHAALQVLQTGEAPPAPPPPARARPWALPPRILAAVGIALLMPAVLAAVGLLRHPATEASPAPGPEVVTAPTPPPSRPAPALASTPATRTASTPATTPAGAADARPSMAGPAVTELPTPRRAPAPSSTPPAPAASVAPGAAPTTVAVAIHVADADSPATAPTPDAAAIARAVAAVDQALGRGDLTAADAGLGELAGLLPARSLTLIRRQAWRAHLGGDAVEAIRLYREIAVRVPDDRTTAINLALLEADEGNVEGASRRLETLRATVGDSAELAAAMAQVGARRP